MTDVKPITIKRNDTRRHSFVITDSEKVLVDISGWTQFVLAVNTLKAPEDDSTQVGTISGAFVTDGTDSRVYFVPPGTWDVGKYFYDAQALDSNSERITFVEGKYTITQDKVKT